MKHLMNTLMITGLLVSVASADQFDGTLNNENREKARQGLKSVKIPDAGYQVVTLSNTWRGPVRYHTIGTDGYIPVPQESTIPKGGQAKPRILQGTIIMVYLMNQDNTEAIYAYPFLVPRKVSVQKVNVYHPEFGKSYRNVPWTEQGVYRYQTATNNRISFEPVVTEWGGGGFGSSLARHPGGYMRVWRMKEYQGQTQTVVSTRLLTEVTRTKSQGLVFQDPNTQEYLVLPVNKDAFRADKQGQPLETYRQHN